MQLDTLVLGPENSKKCVIWLHGLGATASDFVSVVPLLRLPDTRFVFPQAPTRPVTVNGGWPMPSWYDIHFTEVREGRESDADILLSTESITNLVHAQVEVGVSPAHIVLAGFSQGAAMVLHVAERLPFALAGVLVMSGYELRETSRSAEVRPVTRATPRLFCHGTEDLVVSRERGRHAYDRAFEEGIPSVWREFMMGHELCEAQINVIAEWLAERLSGANA